MSDVLKLEIATIVSVHIIAICISIAALVTLYMKSNKTPAFKLFVWVEVSMISWMFFKILKTVAPTVEIRWFSIVAYYLAICLLEPVFLEFGYAYYHGHYLSNRKRFLIYIVAAIQFLVIVTNPSHHLFYKSFDFYSDYFGPLFYVHMIIEYTYILVGSIYCYKKVKEHLSHLQKKYRFLIASAILTPVIFNLIYISGSFRALIHYYDLKVIFDITPIAFTISLLMFMYATFRYEFFNLSPIMQHEIVYELDTPICVLSSRYEVVMANEKFKELLGQQYKRVVQKIVASNTAMFRSSARELKSEYAHKDRFYLLFIKKKNNQILITLDDITSYKLVEEDILSKKREYDHSNIKLKHLIEDLKKSSKEVARNFVAGELHDILGHSLVVTTKLLEVARLYSQKDRALSKRSLSDACISIDEGLAGMRDISKQLGNGIVYSGKVLEKGLEQILLRLDHTGLQTNLIVKGVLHPLTENQVEVIKKVCTELLTNTLKHGDATTLLMSVTITKLSIKILVIDNGAGCEILVCGNGLLGINDRLKCINGHAVFNSNVGEGFSTTIEIIK